MIINTLFLSLTSFGYFAFILLILLYFLPSIVAYNNRKENLTSIVILNVLLGWSFIGWVVAIVWAVSKNKTTSIISPSITKTSDADEIKKLVDLRDQGVLTEEEFQQKKKDFL